MSSSKTSLYVRSSVFHQKPWPGVSYPNNALLKVLLKVPSPEKLTSP
jgi:hypothetical protein